MSDNPNDIAFRSAQLLQSMLADPRTAEEAERLVAVINPEAKFPGRERREAITKPVMDSLAVERAAREALQARLDARDAAEAEAARSRQEDQMMQTLNAVKHKRGFNDETMDRVIARMRQENNPDVEAAAAWVAESIPRPAPATSNYDLLGGQVDPLGMNTQVDHFKGIQENPQQWQTDMLRSIARDPEFARLGNQ